MTRSTFEFGKFSLDAGEHRLLRDGQPVPLTPRLFELLRVLVTNAGHLIDKERLLHEVWNDAVVEEANLNRAISVLRKTLGETPTERYIETVPKCGYRFVAAVQPSTERDGAHEPWSVSRTVPVIRNTNPIARGAVVTGAVFAVALSGVLVLRNSGERAEGVRAPLHRQVTFTGRDSTPTLSPDGTRIAYVSKESPLRKVVVQDINSERRSDVFSAPEAGALRWSPDGHELMFWARDNGEGAQYLATVSGGAARKLAAGIFVSCWSPDGATIALALFTTGRIGFINKAGELQRTIPLEGTREWIWSLDWSAVHGLLVVVDDDRRRPTIWTIQPDGSAQRRVFTSSSEILAARWAPSGDVYYFTRVDHTVSLFKLAIEHERGTVIGEPKALLTGLETDEGFGISSDAKRLVYARASYYSNLWFVDSAANENAQSSPSARQLTHGTAVIERPRVSPDGTTIVFNLGDEARANLYTVPATGGPPRQLTFFNAFSVDGAWSPDGRSIAFASTEGGTRRVWVINADGSAPRPLSAGDMSEAFDVTWAPGTRVLYQQSGNRNFYIVDPESSHERLLIEDSSVGWAASAEYAPDGKTIAVSWNRRQRPGVWLIDPETSRESLAFGVRHASSSPSPIGWTSDGRFIIGIKGKRAAYRGLTASFEETLTEATIVRVPTAGGAAETVLRLPFDEVGGIAMFPDGKRFVVAVYSSRSDIWVVEDFD